MADDRALIILLLGLLLYRSLDLAAAKAKLDQALARARRTLPNPTLRGFRQYRGQLRPKEIHHVIQWYGAARWVSAEFPFLLMLSCLTVLFFLGLVLIGTHANRPESTGRSILAITTLSVSAAISVVNFLLERFRLLLERV